MCACCGWRMRVRIKSNQLKSVSPVTYAGAACTCITTHDQWTIHDKYLSRLHPAAGQWLSQIFEVAYLKARGGLAPFQWVSLLLYNLCPYKHKMCHPGVGCTCVLEIPTRNACICNWVNRIVIVFILYASQYATHTHTQSRKWNRAFILLKILHLRTSPGWVGGNGEIPG